MNERVVTGTLSVNELSPSEQTLKEFDIAASDQIRIESIWLYGGNLTVDASVKLYKKDSGGTYRLCFFNPSSEVTTVVTIPSGTPMYNLMHNMPAFDSGTDIKITVESVGSGAGSVNMEWEIQYEIQSGAEAISTAGAHYFYNDKFNGTLSVTGTGNVLIYLIGCSGNLTISNSKSSGYLTVYLYGFNGSVAVNWGTVSTSNECYLYGVFGNINLANGKLYGLYANGCSGYLYDSTTNRTNTSMSGCLGTGFTGTDTANISNIASIKTKTDGLNFTGTDVKATLDSETVALTDASLTSAKFAAGAIDAAAIADDAIDAGSIKTDAITKIAAGVWNALTSGMSTAGSIGKKLADWVVGTIDTYTGNTKQTGDAYARLGAPAGASISADIATVDTVVDAIKVTTDKFGFTGSNVNAESKVTAAPSGMAVTSYQTAIIGQTSWIMNAIGAFTASGDNTIKGFLKALLSKVAAVPSDVGGTFAASTDSVEALREAIDAETAKIDILDTNIDTLLTYFPATSKNALSVPMSTVTDRNNARILVYLTYNGVAITANRATVNIELWNEQRGSKSSKQALVLEKGSTDGVYSFAVKDIAKYLQLNESYAYFLTSSGTNIDMASGKIILAEKAKTSDIINRVQALEHEVKLLTEAMLEPKKEEPKNGTIQQPDPDNTSRR